MANAYFCVVSWLCGWHIKFHSSSVAINFNPYYSIDTCDGDIDCPLNADGVAEDESYANDGPCNANANNCTFNGKRFLCMHARAVCVFFSISLFFFLHFIYWTGESGFLCDENRCLRKQVVCDGLAQCKDGTDESSDRCAAVSCPPDKFQCKHSQQCIPRSFLCDGNADCSGMKVQLG